MFNALLAANEFDVPEAAVKDEAKNLAEDMKNRMKDQGFESSKVISVQIYLQKMLREELDLDSWLVKLLARTN